MTVHTARITALDSEGRGITRNGGKTVFIENALPGETVRYRVLHGKSRFDEARTEAVLDASPHRRTPPCPHYGECGGCAMQHIEFGAQVAFKQRIFEEQLWRLGKVRPEQILPPLYGAAWHYRSRTRLHLDGRGGRLRLGYQARRSHRICDVETCAVLPQHVDARLPEIRAALQALPEAVRGSLKALEIYSADGQTALNLQSSRPLPEAVLADLAQRWQGWQLWHQHQGAATACANYPPLAYRLPEFGLHLPFGIGDFTQVNLPLNERMVARALQLLDVRPHERVADWFCGLGNFSLPLARQGAEVLGVEGSPQLVARAADNARANGVDNVRFAAADLFAVNAKMLARWGRFDKMLLDPPRAGAYALLNALADKLLPSKLVYVSCNAATLARDAALLQQKGYRCAQAGIINMFAQTAHVEAVACFERT